MYKITFTNGTAVQGLPMFASYEDAIDYLAPNLQSLSDLEEYRIVKC